MEGTAADNLPILGDETEVPQYEGGCPVGQQLRFRQRALTRVPVVGAVAAAALLAVAATVAIVSASGRASAARKAQTDSSQSFFLVQSHSSRKCTGTPGVKFAESKMTTSPWKACAAKWSEDCTDSGCCLDWGLKCYQKNDGWAACKASCDKVDEKNDTWTCKELSPPTPRTDAGCEERCLSDSTCKQAIYNSDAGGSCSLTAKRHSEVVWAGDNYNSSYCGAASEEAEIKKLIEKASGQLPMRLPPLPLNNCSWGGEDCSETKCCNDVSCDEHFTACYPYSCYKKTEYFSGCRIQAPPKDWDGTWLGGGAEHRVIPAGGAQVQIQGTSLYCFSVISWDAPRPKPFWSTEAELANNIKTHGVSIFQCDGHDFYNGIQTPKAAWGSFSNIDAFQEIWKNVQAKGAYKNFDWTVKVDADAVFLPNRLKMHLDKLRTPKGSKVYLENINYQFKFMGALEVLTREALDLFLDLGHTCIRGKHEGGEDFFMKGCMDALGIDHQTDFELLHDKYGGQDGPCTDGWAVAYHFHKKIISWNWCYNEAVCGNRGKTCPQGLEVEFVMPWKPGNAGR
mmetsp:Transcript_54162/g.137615  ORF Transcript_54162/g.137615 Transcript_54162/m.137615 type:complete len:567 (+) Transcript_54162:78-1778(+)